MFIAWGAHRAMLYNDAYIAVLAGKHPAALGQPAQEVWGEIWHILGPHWAHVFDKGEATWAEDLLLLMNRSGYDEETYFTFSYSPIRDEMGSVGGMFCACQETTHKVVGERRLKTLRELAAQATMAKSAKEACATATQTLSGNHFDLPFALLYLCDGNRDAASLAGAAGLVGDGPASPSCVALDREGSDGWPLGQVLRDGTAQCIENLPDRFGSLPAGPWTQPTTRALLLPLQLAANEPPAGVLIAGISPVRPLDEGYRTFLEVAAGQIASSIANARAYEQERQKAEALAELDRAKTAFFSNVSHEFRTPLTLMLGPVEDLLGRSHTDLPPAAKGQLEVVNRNGLRLLRLVNTLLDFSRIEAGRVQAVFEPTDLAAFTAELASVFRAATERAGLGLKVDCARLPEAVYVDRDMWEKIVLNLISNAFKFTFEGEIEVSIHAESANAVLTVRDTGVGIPAEEMPRIFERFHRIQNMRSRTHEGSGIGLALVHELVKLHCGSIRAESDLGKGTAFIVTIPLGSKHLPAEHLGSSRNLASTAVGAAPFVEEALRWLPQAAPVEEAAVPPSHHELMPVPCPWGDGDVGDGRARIIVADDNADMRHYLARMLSERYNVKAVPDGQAALAAARQNRPDLILSDVMMPNLDGFGLVRELRADRDLKTIPTILLSARAGEEARVEGMQQGADDYLVKPFSTRELLARVAAHLDMAALRKEAQEQIRRSEEQYRLLFDKSPDGIFCVDPAGKFTQANPACQAISGYTRSEMLQMTFMDICAPDQLAHALEHFHRGLAQRIPLQFEVAILHKDGRRVELWISGEPLLEGDAVAGAHCTARDITDRKRAEEALRASEEKYRNLFNSMDEGFFLIDVIFDDQDRAVDMCYVEANAAATRILGMDFTGKRLREISPDYEEYWYEVFGEVARTGQGAQMERYAAHDHKWYSFYVFKVGGPESRRIGNVFTDITDRKQAEEALRESEERLKRVARAGQIGFYEWNVTHNTGYWSQEHYELFGIPSGSAISYERWLACVHPDDRARISRSGASLLAQAKNRVSIDLHRDEYRVLLPDGATIWVETTTTIQPDDGHDLVMRGSVRQITERKLAEEAIRQAKEDLEQRVAARTAELKHRSEQLARLAAELALTEQRERCRLAQVLHDGLQQLLVGAKFHLAVLERAGDSAMRKAISNVLNLLDDSIETSRSLTAELSPPILHEGGLIPALEWLARWMQEKHGLRVDISVPRLTKPLREDITILLFQATRELLFNVVKHAGVKSTKVCVTRPNGSIQITVADEGTGFDPEAIRGRTVTGGFGLFSIRERLGLLGGTIEIDSAPSRGSRFTLVAPALPPAPPQAQQRAQISVMMAPPVQDAAEGRIRIVLVDDHIVMRQGMASLLREEPDMVIVGEASDGESAVSLVRELRPDVVLMDISMPGMNGIEATRILHAEFPNTRIIGLSMFEQDEQAKAMLEAGAAEYLTKSGPSDALVAAIRKHANA
ncbi:MAG: response regulator [Planctomycetaceae bacterium]|nr:response regulator [Planctomycetaceae bacterium]